MSAGRRSLLELSAMLPRRGRKDEPIVDCTLVCNVTAGDRQTFYAFAYDKFTTSSSNNGPATVDVDIGDEYYLRNYRYTGYSYTYTFVRTSDSLELRLHDGNFISLGWFSNGGSGHAAQDGAVSATVSDIIKELAYCCFYNCSNLASVTGMKNVVRVQSNAFYNCKSIEAMNFASPLEFIGSQAFYNCNECDFSVTISDGCELGASAFSGCYKLRGVKFLGRVSVSGTSQFVNCRAIGGDTANAFLLALSGTTVNVSANTFSGCSGIEDVVVPSGFTTISSRSFGACTGLKRFSVPSSVVAFNASAFRTLTSYLVGDGLVIEMIGRTMAEVKAIKSTTSASSAAGFPFGLEPTQTKEQAVFHCSDGYMDCAGNPVEM